MAKSTIVTMGAIALTIGVAAAASSGLQTGSGPGDQLVRQLGEFRAAFPAWARSDGRPDPVEERRIALYAQLRALGPEALPALARGLADPDVQIRRNAALFLVAAGSGGYGSSQSRMDIQACLAALISAVQDGDARVRELAAQAIGEIGPNAAPAVPALVTLLSNADEGSRNSACIGLRGIGPPAMTALPALRAAVLSDASANVRRFAQRAIEMIDVPR